MDNKFCENAGPLMELSKAVGKVEKGLQSLESHFENHVSQHRYEKVLQAVYFGLTVLMFCLLRWWR